MGKYDSLTKEELLRLMEARDRREATRYGLVWETDGIEAEQAINGAQWRLCGARSGAGSLLRPAAVAESGHRGRQLRRAARPAPRLLRQGPLPRHRSALQHRQPRLPLQRPLHRQGRPLAALEVARIHVPTPHLFDIQSLRMLSEKVENRQMNRGKWLFFGGWRWIIR